MHDAPMLAPMDARWAGTQSTIVRPRFHRRQSRETRTGIRGLMNPFERGRWRWLPLVLGFLAAPSQAQPGANPASPTPPPPPVPYSLPWQLRPAAVANTLRLDTSIGFWEDAAGRAGDTWVSGLSATRKVTNRVALLGRVSYIDNHPPSPAQEKAGTAVSNPLLARRSCGVSREAAVRPCFSRRRRPSEAAAGSLRAQHRPQPSPAPSPRAPRWITRSSRSTTSR